MKNQKFVYDEKTSSLYAPDSSFVKRLFCSHSSYAQFLIRPHWAQLLPAQLEPQAHWHHDKTHLPQGSFQKEHPVFRRNKQVRAQQPEPNPEVARPTKVRRNFFYLKNFGVKWFWLGFLGPSNVARNSILECRSCRCLLTLIFYPCPSFLCGPSTYASH